MKETLSREWPRDPHRVATVEGLENLWASSDQVAGWTASRLTSLETILTPFPIAASWPEHFISLQDRSELTKNMLS